MLHRQFVHFPAGRPGRFGDQQRGVHPAQRDVGRAFAGGQVQVQVRDLAMQALQARDHPARQQAARATQHQDAAAGAATQPLARRAQQVQRRAGGLAQAPAFGGQGQAAPAAFEQGAAQVLLEHAQLAAHGTVGDMQLFGSLAHASGSRGSLESLDGIERRQFVHGWLVRKTDNKAASYRDSLGSDDAGCGASGMVAPVASRRPWPGRGAESGRCPFISYNESS